MNVRGGEKRKRREEGEGGKDVRQREIYRDEDEEDGSVREQKG